MESSLFDRLTDEHPRLSEEVYVSEWEQMRQLKSSVARDLADLLNTTRSDADLDPAFEQTRNSIVNFGVPDFVSCKLLNPADREKIRAGIELAIRRFEPRLSRVSVEVDEPSSVHPILYFRVNALLRTSPAEPVQFAAVLSGDTRSFQVKGETR